MDLNKNRVAVGISGGVDSSVTAYILKEQGYEVVGITMIIFDEYDEDGNKIENSFLKDARDVCKKLEIEHHIVDFREEFENIVKKEFVEEYAKGRTPNPCVTCNKHIKYGRLIKEAHKLGAYWLATGHYATVKYDEETNRYKVFKGRAHRKDQGYMLHSLKQEQLKHVMLPLGIYHSKDEIRKIAESINLEVAKKTDSTGICFIPKGTYPEYISKNIPKAVKRGEFVDKEGNFIGYHRGIACYTIGQKRNLGIELEKDMYVIKIDAENNKVVLGEDIDTYSSGFIVKNSNIIKYSEIDEIRAEVKVCQWGWFLLCTIKKIDEDKLKVVFDKKERAITKGQAAVFYHDDEVIGGGTIDEIIK